MMEKKPTIVVVGSLNMDIVVEADRPPLMGETVSGTQAHFIPGGKGANQAVAAARLGARTHMIGAVGDDAFGGELMAAMQKEGIATDSIKRVADVPTGIASILLSQGDNSIVVVAGANAHTLPEDIDRHLAILEAADAVLLQLEIPLETVVYTAQQAKRLGKTVILNPAPARALPDELLQLIDVLIPNESELYLLAGTPEGELELAMQALLAKGVGCVVTTLGAAGAAYLQPGDPLGRVPGRKVKVVDTTGAGDSFNAGFAYALAGGNSVPEAIHFATRVAALAVTKLGAQQGMPTLREVLEFTE